MTRLGCGCGIRIFREQEGSKDAGATCVKILRGLIVQTIVVKTDRRTQLLDVTAQVQKAVSAAKVPGGVCYLHVPHTTAAITINECADPHVARDVECALDRLIPATGPYRHSEGNSDSHVKSVLVGSSQVVLVEDGKLALGRWQGIFFCEFDGPRERKLFVKVVADRD
jgi:secondary thiamine-phosphate synthase enzyme